MRLIPKSSFKTWIIGITRRKIADFYRKFYKNKEEQSIDINVFEYGEDIYFEKDIEQLADKIVVQNAVSTLSGIEKELVYLIFNAQLTYRQVAQITNIPNGTIKSKMFSIKAKLKNSLSKEGEYD
jgi:RNA polymerase sigma-70 factor (ECF subfamily)